MFNWLFNQLTTCTNDFATRIAALEANTSTTGTGGFGTGTIIDDGSGSVTSGGGTGGFGTGTLS